MVNSIISFSIVFDSILLKLCLLQEVGGEIHTSKKLFWLLPELLVSECRLQAVCKMSTKRGRKLCNLSIIAERNQPA